MIVLAIAGVALAGPTTVAGADPSAAFAPRRVALVIGVDVYGDPALQTLAFAGKDARDLGGALKDTRYGGYDDVRVVTGVQATTRQGIRDAIADAAADLQRDDTFLLYLSGHGTLALDPIDGTRLFFLPSDGQLDRPEQTAISVTWLEQEMDHVASKRRVLILDTCHNGRGRSGLSNATAEHLRTLRGDPPPPRVSEVSEYEARLFAADFHQPAIEDKTLQNGVYTHFLVDALTTSRVAADLNRDGVVEVREAHAWAMDGTIRHTGGLQMPRAEYSEVGNEAIYLSGDPSLRRRAETALLSAYEGILASAQLWVDGTSRGALPGLVAIEPGLRDVELRAADGRTIARRRVRVEAGETVQLDRWVGETDGPRASLLLGATFQAGPATRYTATWAGDLEVSVRLRPNDWVSPEVHGRAQVGAGVWADSGTQPQLSAMPSLGASVGFGGRVRVGPELEIGAPGRLVGSTAEAMVAPLGGVRLEARLGGRGGVMATLRADSRVFAYPVVGNDWTWGTLHGVALGGTFR